AAAYYGLIVNLINPMNRMASFVGDLAKAMVATGRAYELLDLPVEEEISADPQPMPGIRGAIEFRDVSFWYNRDEAPALGGVQATVEAGEIVALVGPSGAGK